MGGKHTLIRTLVVTSIFGAMATGVSAEQLPTPPAHVLDAAAANVSEKREVAVVPAPGVPVTAAQVTSTELEADGLRKDPRWPLFRHCIEDTATPKEFETCLQSAFMSDTTGLSTSLAPK